MIKDILETHQGEDILMADGFDDAVIGIATDFTVPRLIYSVNKCIDILMSDNMSYSEAMEHFTFNVSGGWVGDKTPIWCWDDFD